MSANPIDKNSTPKTTGNLEELFRHHLGEEAAVPPRPMLWDQIDNSLLIRQNETYRRRLAATRWVAAASLLLATLAGAGWWATREARFGGDAAATATRPTAPTVGASAASLGKETGAGDQWQDVRRQPAPATVAADAALSGNHMAATRADAASQYAANSMAAAAQNDGYEPATPRNELAATRLAAAPAGVGSASAAANLVAAGGPRSAALMAGPAQTSANGGVGSPVAARTIGRGLAASGAAAATTAGAVAAAAPATVGASSAAALEPAGLLAARAASMLPTDLAALPNGLAPVALPAEADLVTVPAARKWHYSASYTAGTFNPNINFSRAGIAPEYDYNPALGPDSPALTEAAAAQYRRNLRPGLSQRLALLATRHLGGHWSLTTGAELGQARATSAAPAAFVGEQLLDLGPVPAGPLRTSNFRYRTASVPVAVRYANPAKRGWSLYGHFGGVVSALLGARSEVDGSPEATRTYSLISASTPYRRVLGSVRGGAGARFCPAASNWALTLGPVAELGLVPLNAHPAQNFMAQSRPYSFGVEAGVEFGR